MYMRPVTVNRGGRPPVAGVARSVRMVLQATPAEAKAWKAEAKRRGVTFSDLVRTLMNAAAKRGAQK